MTTIGVDFLKRDVQINYDMLVTLMLWDVAGQSKFASFKQTYYKGSNLVIIVFDVTNQRSYHSIARWLKDAQAIMGEKIDFAIFANKVDLEDQREVFNYDDYTNYPTLFEIIETSAKTGYNVNDIFARIAKFLLKKKGIIIEDLKL